MRSHWLNTTTFSPSSLMMSLIILIHSSTLVYHFPNAGKMIFNLFSSIKASVFCSFYDSFKSFPFGIIQYLCKFSCTPALYAFIFLAIASNCSNNSLIFSSFIIVYFSIILQKYTFYLVVARKVIGFFEFYAKNINTPKQGGFLLGSSMAV